MKAQNRFCLMFRIVALERSRALTIPRRSPDIRTTSALSMAMSVPVPMAMPTLAWARAGASLIPSPTNATLRPPCCSVTPAPGGDGPGGSLVVACEHGDAPAQPVQLFYRLPGAVLELVGNADAGCWLAVDRREYGRGGPAGQLLALLPEEVEVQSFRFEQPGRADQYLPAVYRGFHALAGNRFELLGRQQLEVPGPGCLDERPRQRMLGVHFDRGNQPQHLTAVHPPRFQVHDSWPALS